MFLQSVFGFHTSKFGSLFGCKKHSFAIIGLVMVWNFKFLTQPEALPAIGICWL